MFLKKTIEHLDAFELGGELGVSDGVDEEPAREYRNRIVHTIGNLTLVNQTAQLVAVDPLGEEAGGFARIQS